MVKVSGKSICWLSTHKCSGETQLKGKHKRKTVKQSTQHKSEYKSQRTRKEGEGEDTQRVEQKTENSKWEMENGKRTNKLTGDYFV